MRKNYGLHQYRGSMAGAGVVVGTIRAAAALSLPINITGVIPLCENMPSGMAVKPGDVIMCMNGKTIAVDVCQVENFFTVKKYLNDYSTLTKLELLLWLILLSMHKMSINLR